MTTWYKIHFKHDFSWPDKGLDLVRAINEIKSSMFSIEGFNVFEPIKQQSMEWLYYIPKPDDYPLPWNHITAILNEYGAVECPKPDGTDLKASLASYPDDYEFWFGLREPESGDGRN